MACVLRAGQHTDGSARGGQQCLVRRPAVALTGCTEWAMGCGLKGMTRRPRRLGVFFGTVSTKFLGSFGRASAWCSCTTSRSKYAAPQAGGKHRRSSIFNSKPRLRCTTTNYDFRAEPVHAPYLSLYVVRARVLPVATVIHSSHVPCPLEIGVARGLWFTAEEPCTNATCRVAAHTAAGLHWGRCEQGTVACMHHLPAVCPERECQTRVGLRA